MNWLTQKLVLQKSDLDIQRISSVMQCAVSGFKRHLIGALKARLSLKKHRNLDHNQLSWLGDDVDSASEPLLHEDQEVLRVLEAEIYALNDQFKTETQHGGGMAL